MLRTGCLHAVLSAKESPMKDFPEGVSKGALRAFGRAFGQITLSGGLVQNRFPPRIGLSLGSRGVLPRLGLEGRACLPQAGALAFSPNKNRSSLA
jgi:hypothetical protein